MLTPNSCRDLPRALQRMWLTEESLWAALRLRRQRLKKCSTVQTRENLNETAFFYPALQTDDEGNVAIRFTLPESITTWRFVGLAHNREMCHGVIDAEAVAQKTVMVQPNMPRFLREGDKAVVAVRVFNNSDRKVNGNARMQILDPETNKVVWQQTQKYNPKPTDRHR